MRRPDERLSSGCSGRAHVGGTRAEKQGCRCSSSGQCITYESQGVSFRLRRCSGRLNSWAHWTEGPRRVYQDVFVPGTLTHWVCKSTHRQRNGSRSLQGSSSPPANAHEVGVGAQRAQQYCSRRSWGHCPDRRRRYIRTRWCGPANTPGNGGGPGAVTGRGRNCGMQTGIPTDASPGGQITSDAPRERGSAPPDSPRGSPPGFGLSIARYCGRLRGHQTG